MRLRSLGFVLALLMFALRTPPLRALDLRDFLADYTVTSWSQRDGFSNLVIRAMAQDLEGFLWLGTDAGLLRFDGLRFVPWQPAVPMSLPLAPVRALWAARDGSLWIGFQEPGGVSRIRAGEVRNFTASDGIGSGAVTTLFEDAAGNIWAGSGDGLRTFTGERWTQEDGLAQSPVNAIRADQHGRIFVATGSGVFSRSNPNEAFERIVGLDESVEDLSADAQGRIWLTDRVLGFKAVGETTDPDPSAQRGVGQRLLHDSRGNLWIGTGGQGLWRIRADSATDAPIVERVTALTGLSTDGVISLLEDWDGNIWAGTPDGLNRLTPRKVTPLLNLGPVRGVEATPDGSVWVGTVDGLIEYPHGSLQSGNDPKPLQISSLSAMHADERGRLWVATERGLLWFFDGDVSPVPFRDSAVPMEVSAITSDLDGGAWLYDRQRGLLRWTEGRLHALALPPAVGRVPAVCMYTDRGGRLWISFVNGRLATVNRAGEIQVYNAGAGEYRAIYEDPDGVVWLGGTQGLSRVTPGGIVRLGAAESFPAASVTAIIEDEARGLWVGIAGSGILHINRDELEIALARSSDPVRYSVYDRSDGSAGTPRWSGNRAAIRAADGQLWFVTGRGVTIIDPSSLEDDVPPRGRVQIDRVIANGRPVGVTSDPSLPAGTARLEIQYTIPRLTSPLRTQFRYRLDGVDRDWVDGDTQRAAVYTNLPPREYSFHVVAGNDDGTWAEPGTIWSFSIQPRFYQRGWFPVASLGLLVLAVVGTWRFRVWLVRPPVPIIDETTSLLQERARLSREMHDTVLQSLVGVALQCDALAENSASVTPSKNEKLVQLRKTLEEQIREARRSIWGLRDPKLHARDLAGTLRVAGEDATAEQHIGFDFTATGAPRACRADVHDQLVRIGREAVINAVRHARPTQIRMQLRYSRKSVVLRVSDDGCGFHPESLAGDMEEHLGLLTMKERAEIAGGIFKISSQVGKGTEIEVVVPA